MQSSHNFETSTFQPHTENVSLIKSERVAQRLSQVLRAEGRNANEQLQAHGLGVIENFPGEIDFDVPAADAQDDITIEKTQESDENDVSNEEVAQIDISLHAPEDTNELVTIGVELPSASTEELQAALAQYYYTLPAFEIIRHRYLSQENADLAVIEERLHTVCNKMKDDTFANFKKTMLTQAEAEHNMDSDAAEKYFDLRMNQYTRNNTVYLQDHGAEQLIIAQDFFSQDALSAIDDMIIKPVHASSSQSANELVRPELHMDNTIDLHPGESKNTDRSVHASENIDKMYDELGKISFE
jgi:hypothetical protein